MRGENRLMRRRLFSPRPSFLGWMRVAPQRRGALAHRGGRRGGAPMTPPHTPPGLAAVQKVGRGAGSPPLPGSAEMQEAGRGKTLDEFPLAAGDSFNTDFRRTAKEVGGGGGRKPRRLRWFLPPQRRLKSIAFAVLKIWICFGRCWYVFLAEISDAGCGEKTDSCVVGCSPRAPHSPAGCASRRNDAALCALGRAARGAPMTPPQTPPEGR